MATIDLSEIEALLGAIGNAITNGNAKLDALIAAVKAIPSTGGGEPTDPPDPKQRWGVQGRKFTKDGAVIPFLKGMNVRPIAYYIKGNTPHPLNYMTQYAHIADVEKTLNRAATMGTHVIRFYAAISTLPNGNLGTDIDYCVQRTIEMVNFINGRGMGALIVLTDNATSGFHVYDNDAKYRTNTGLTLDWYKSGYKGKYLAFVSAVVTALKDHQGVFGFETGNEFHSQQPFGIPESDVMLAFMGDMATYIKNIAPNRLVLPGVETAHQLFAHNKGVYFPQYLATKYDALSIHCYDPTSAEPLGGGTKIGVAPNLAEEYELKQTQKPVYIGEFGVSRVGNSRNAAPITQQWINYVKSKNVAAAFQWGLAEAEQPGANIGYHDAASFDTAEHNHDFGDLVSVWSGT